MINEFIPDIIVEDIFNINYEKLYNNGIRLLIFDIDGTILKSLNFEVSEELINLFAYIKRLGFAVVLLTNAGEIRLDPVLSMINIESGIASANKPSNKAFEKVLEKHTFTKDQIAMIGNDIYTDIYGANHFGAMSIFVGSLDLNNNLNKVNSFILKKAKAIQNKFEKK